jgi:retron-type reverse transcriptase
LLSAWSIVRESGINSKSAETKKLVDKFSLEYEKHIENIYRQLLYKKFSFTPAHGVLQNRPRKDPRPLVISSLADRIVRRSILDVLQEQEAIKPFYESTSSFGGIKKRGVRQAIEAALIAIRDGASFYLRSDIQTFFMKLPRPKVLAILHNALPDPIFNQLLSDATTTELINLSKLGRRKHLFPTYTIGVAQGCCLSPLLGNVLLNDFDKQMNSRGITCLRYIDDFIILGKSQNSVSKAFTNARLLLAEHGLHAYIPATNSFKAAFGKVQDGFEFLGCQIIPGLIRPDEKARQRLLSKIEDILKESYTAMSSPEETVKEKKSFIQSLMDIHNTIKGWGNQYSFCNDQQMMENLDIKIYEIVGRYIHGYSERVKRLDYKNRRRIFGVHCLTDSKHRPLLPLKS